MYSYRIKVIDAHSNQTFQTSESEYLNICFRLRKLVFVGFFSAIFLNVYVVKALINMFHLTSTGHHESRVNGLL